MNKLLKSILLTGISISLLGTTAFATKIGGVKTPPLKIGDKFEVSSIKFDKTPTVLDIKTGDVDGDKMNDTVMLLGTKVDNTAPYCNNIYLVIQNGKTKKYTKTNIPSDGGYDSSYLFLGDFNGDKIKDIMVSIPTGGSGGTSSYGIYSDAQDKFSTLFDMKKLGIGLQFSGNLMDHYKATITSQYTGKSMILDLSSHKNDYDSMSVYDASGKLLKDVAISCDGYSVLYPVDYDRDGKYELQGYQRIWGVAHVDTLTNVISNWSFSAGKFNLTDLNLTYSLMN